MFSAPHVRVSVSQGDGRQDWQEAHPWGGLHFLCMLIQLAGFLFKISIMSI